MDCYSRVSWYVLRFFAYYDFLSGGLEAMFKHSDLIDPFGVDDDDDGGSGGGGDDDNVIDVIDMNVALDANGPSSSTGVRSSTQFEESFEDLLALFDKQVEEAKEEAIDDKGIYGCKTNPSSLSFE